MRVIVCGGGVIGTSIAYFLSLRGAEAIVVERAGVANAASGKSGGFLALDWCRGTPVDPLARRSFALHAELAESLGIDWGYRRLDTLGVAASLRRDFGRLRRLPSPAWLGPGAAVHAQLGTEATTAQIHPAAFTRGMMTAAGRHGARLVTGAVEGIALTPDGSRLTGVVVDSETVEADAAVLALGPWSLLACRWLPLPGVYGLKGHSLVFRYTPEGDPKALFVELETEDGQIETPEVMPRTDGTTYICGMRGDDALPVDPAQVRIEPGGTEKLRAMAAAISPALGAAEVIAEQSCFRPICEDGLPLMGPVPGVEGAYVATGHSVWGMLNGPATGEAMAELVLDGAARTVDIAPFDPSRLDPFDAGRLRTGE